MTNETRGRGQRLIALFLVVQTLAIVGSGQCWALDPAPVVSMISLIANPEKFDRKPVWVTGYARFGFEESSLFLCPYDAQERIDDNALAIFVDLGKLKPHRKPNESEMQNREDWEAIFDHHTVVVKGTFLYPKEGFWTGYPNGIIDKITDIDLNDTRPRMGKRVN